jgi:L-fuculose-phosphate aldolase
MFSEAMHMNIIYPTDTEAKRDILEAGRRLYQKNFVAANDGNISARVSDSEVWATPTGVSKGFMTEEMLVKLNLDGSVVFGTHRPSSEIRMHLKIYKEAPEILAVAHAHPPVAAAFAAAGLPLDRALLQEAVVLLGVVPVAPYALPGSDALAESVVPYLRKHNGLLLEHHGAVSWGESVMQALYRLESIEYNATVTMYTRLMGIERPMTESQIDGLIALRSAWGVSGGGRPKGREEN